MKALPKFQDIVSLKQELMRMKAELKRTTEERDILKKVAAYFARQSVIIHSDQGCQFGSDDFVRWCKDNRLIPGMSCRGNCYDNAVAESFFWQFEGGAN